MHRHSQQHSIDFVAVLILFASFCLVGAVMIVLGTQIYQNVVTRMSTNSNQRTAAAYITQKVRQNADRDAISIGEIDGHSALLIRADYDGTPYVTYLYQNEGNLCELFCAEDAGLSADAGSAVLPLQSLRFEALPAAGSMPLSSEEAAVSSSSGNADSQSRSTGDASPGSGTDTPESILVTLVTEDGLQNRFILHTAVQ